MSPKAIAYSMLVVLCVVIILAINPFHIVDTGERGVKVTFGEVVGKPLDEGFYVYNPLTSSIVDLNVKTQRWDDKTMAYTKDVQQATLQYAINYNLMPQQAGEVYKTVGRDFEEILIPPIVQGSMKAQIGQWDAVDLIENRDKAVRAIEEFVATGLKTKGINVTRLEIVDIQFEGAFENAVERKVIAIQDAIREKNRTVQVQEQATQKVIGAKAEAESMQIRNEALRQNKALIEYEAVQKWNGVLPQYVMGDSVPLINMPQSGK